MIECQICRAHRGAGAEPVLLATGNAMEHHLYAAHDHLTTFHYWWVFVRHPEGSVAVITLD